MKNVLILGCSDEDILTAAILHDVLEDTDYSEVEMIKEFGETVTSIVKTVSKPKNYTTEKALNYYTNIFNNSNEVISVGACYVKLADRLDNLLSVSLTNEKEYAVKYYEDTKKYYPDIASKIGKEDVMENLLKKSLILINNK